MEENNKLIAVFMGRVIPEEQLEFLDENPTTHYYHSNWNWLMEVVDKIESIEGGIFNVNILRNGTQVTHINAVEYFIINNVAEINYSEKIDHVYDAVVKFIKWYNEQ